ncbi:MAG: hypothetical protein MZV63_17275 [Marinilabiliales bacterium]|nr:hypothetical protein [Marinilabiliales bacterium]
MAERGGSNIRRGEPATAIRRTSRRVRDRTTPQCNLSAPRMIRDHDRRASLSEDGSDRETGALGRAQSLGQTGYGDFAPALTPLLIRNFPFAALAVISFEQMPLTVWRGPGKDRGTAKAMSSLPTLVLSGPGIS